MAINVLFFLPFLPAVCVAFCNFQRRKRHVRSPKWNSQISRFTKVRDTVHDIRTVERHVRQRGNIMCEDTSIIIGRRYYCKNIIAEVGSVRLGDDWQQKSWRCIGTVKRDVGPESLERVNSGSNRQQDGLASFVIVVPGATLLACKKTLGFCAIRDAPNCP